MNHTLVEVKKKLNENCEITSNYIEKINQNVDFESIETPRIEPFTNTLANLQETVMIHNRV